MRQDQDQGSIGLENLSANGQISIMFMCMLGCYVSCYFQKVLLRYSTHGSEVLIGLRVKSGTLEATNFTVLVFGILKLTFLAVTD